jgi:OOP family OmpA-OmpF porin
MHAARHARHLFLAAALLGALVHGAQADTGVPKQDLKGLSDPAGLKRFAGAVLVYRDDVAYDEVKLPVGKAIYKDEKASVARTLDRAGQRTALQYITPPDRSALEVLRNYQQEQKGAGFETVYECAGEACGEVRDIYKDTLAAFVLPDTWWSKAGDNTPAACGAGHFISDFRYAVLDNKASGAAIALMVWKPGDVSVYCEEKEFKKRISVVVVKVEPKAREQKMETLSAAASASWSPAAAPASAGPWPSASSSLGADVAICGRRKSVCDETAAEWREQFPERRIDTFGVDIRVAQAVEEMVRRCGRAAA